MRALAILCRVVRRCAFVAVATVIFLSHQAQAAELQLGTPFSDQMVVQYGRPFPMWGRATQGDAVRIEVAGRRWEGRADGAGNWRVDVGPLDAGGPYVFTVVAGEDRKELRDVLAGELWLCAGQSNMAASMREVANTEAEVVAANFPQIRMLRVPEAPADEPWDYVNAEWKSCTPATAMGFSGTGYYFGRKLHRELKMPIGLVVCAWGGSSVPAWMSRAALNAPEIRRQMPYDMLGWRENVRPNKLYCGMLNPIVPLGVRGVIWYQGETEGDPGQNAYLYRHTFPAMIQDWRRVWGRPELPFYYVQLPNLKNHPQWPIVRESQAAALRLPHTGMITTLDIGESDHLHPQNKLAFGERLADLVLAREYGMPLTVDGPRLREARPEGATMRVLLDHAVGLRTADGKSPLAFTVAGEDRQFVNAEASIDGESVVVQNARVSKPVAVRYAWASDPKVNLVNEAGLPLSPFRTDDWPVEGQQLIWLPLPSQPSLAVRVTAAAAVGGESGWQWAGSGIEPTQLIERRHLRPLDGGRSQLVASERTKPGGPATPALVWTRDLPTDPGGAESVAFDPTKGCTVELQLQVVKITTPLSGVELAATLPDREKQLRTYRIAMSPMRLHGFTSNEIAVLGYNLDNTTGYHAYRISVRPDGIAQIYYDGREMGVLAGEPVTDKTVGPSISWGKRAQGGGMTANVESISFDFNGAFAP